MFIYELAYVGIGWFFLLVRLLVAWDDDVDMSPKLFGILLGVYGLFWPLIWVYRLTGKGFKVVLFLVDVFSGVIK